MVRFFALMVVALILSGCANGVVADLTPAGDGHARGGEWAPTVKAK